MVLVLSTGIRLPFLGFATVFVTLVVLGTWYTLVPILVILAYVAHEYYQYPKEHRRGSRECCYHKYSPILLSLYFLFFLNIAFLVVRDVAPAEAGVALSIALTTPFAVLLTAYGALLAGRRQLHKQGSPV